MLGLGILYAVVAPVVLVKTIQRREWQRLYELAVLMLFTAGFLMMTLWPTVIQNAWAVWPPLHWLYLSSTVLMLVNFFGFSGWLFNRHRNRQI